MLWHFFFMSRVLLLLLLQTAVIRLVTKTMGRDDDEPKDLEAETA